MCVGDLAIIEHNHFLYSPWWNKRQIASLGYSSVYREDPTTTEDGCCLHLPLGYETDVMGLGYTDMDIEDLCYDPRSLQKRDKEREFLLLLAFLLHDLVLYRHQMLKLLILSSAGPNDNAS